MKRRRVDSENRVIGHIDLDCFYVQVERSLNPSLKGLPVAVVQYDPFGDLRSLGAMDNRIIKKGGGLIAVSYEARALGVKRNVRGGEAKVSCPELVLVQVPTSHGKADLTIYRDASAKIVTVLSTRYPACIVERASIDEVYLDVTGEAIKLLDSVNDEQLVEFIQILKEVPTTIAGEDAKEIQLSRSELSRGHEGASDHMAEGQQRSSWFNRPLSEWALDDKLLLCGSMIIRNLRSDVFQQLGFTCSGGIARNKMLAKLASGMHKPNKQTIVPNSVIRELMESLPLSRIQGLGGKLGKAVRQEFGDRIQVMGDILMIERSELLEKFGEESVQWMVNAAQGIDYEPVEDRTLVLSIGCSKSYVSSNMLTPDNMLDGVVLKWYTELAEELCERVRADTAANNRVPKHLTVGLGITPYNESDEQEKEETRRMLNSTMGAQARRNDISSTFSISKIIPMVPSATPEKLGLTALSVAQRCLTEHPKMQTPALLQGMYRITGLSMGASNFIDIAVGAQSISSFFAKGGAGSGGGTTEHVSDPFASVSPVKKTSSLASGSDAAGVAAGSGGSENQTANHAGGALKGFLKTEGSKVDLFSTIGTTRFPSNTSSGSNNSSTSGGVLGAGISSYFKETASSSSSSSAPGGLLFQSTSSRWSPTSLKPPKVGAAAAPKPSVASFFSKSAAPMSKKTKDTSFIDLTEDRDDPEEYGYVNTSSDVGGVDCAYPSSMDDIDPEVFSDLPVDIQRELLASLKRK